MNSPQTTPSAAPRSRASIARQALRSDTLVIAVAVVLAGLLTFLLDTGFLARWAAQQRETRIDEVIVVSFGLVCALGFFAMRRWLALSYQVIRAEESGQGPVSSPRSALRRDLIVITTAMCVGLVLVSALDTGNLAGWVARQSHTRVDEAIAGVVMLMLGLTFFSVRRWLELSRQLGLSDQLYRSTVELNREITLLGELNELLQSCRSTDEAQRLIAERAQLLFPFTSGAVCVLSDERDRVDVMAQWGSATSSTPSFPVSDCWALRRGEMLALAAAPSVLRCTHVAGHPGRGLCVPMVAHGETMGLLYLQDDRPAERHGSTGVLGWSDTERRLAKTLTEQAALSFTNLALRETLHQQSTSDSLTGLFNRRHLDQSLELHLRQAQVTGKSVAVCMIDVDHFKRFNDTFGHDAGDDVLRSVAGLLRARVRSRDVVCRWGGEEFVIVMPDSSLATARQRADEIRVACEGMAIESQGRPLEHVTLSIGVAQYPDHGSSAADLLQAADRALYDAKRHGRDQVIVAA